MATKAETFSDHWSVAATSGMVPLSERPFEMPFLPGQIVAGKYEIVNLIGVGGVGFVVAANHIELGERVALKFLRPEMLAREDIVARFAQEAHAAVRIKNEHVARVFDVGALPNGCPFIVMEFLEGRDLYEVVVNDGPQPVKRAIDYVLQACVALAEAHAIGIVHRDIKPENLFLIQRSEGLELIKVLDFGISKVALTGSAFKSKVPLVRTMMPMGSPVYMSPEQIRASKDIDVRTDIWSIGCVLHELLTGKPAFDAPSLTQLSATILEDHPAKVSELLPSVPAELDAIVTRCLQKSPIDRFQNMAEFALALYPFGPRRSKLSAERCCMLLKLNGAGQAEFELPSVRPPGWDSLPSGSYPMTNGLPRATPTRLETASAVDLQSQRSRTRRIAIVVGVSLGIGIAITAALGVFSGPNADQPAASSAAVEPALAKAPTPQQKPAVRPSDAAAVAPPLQVTPPVPPADKVAPINKQVRPTQRVVKPKKKSSGRGDAATSAEPDPGF